MENGDDQTENQQRYHAGQQFSYQCPQTKRQLCDGKSNEDTHHTSKTEI